MKSLLAFIAVFCFSTSALAQVEYRFNDSPRPDADVVVANYHLIVVGTDLWLVGRLFNRGLKPARNVRIVPNLYSKYGGLLPATTIDLRPSDIPPTSFVEFSDRVLMFPDREVSARPVAEWSQ